MCNLFATLSASKNELSGNGRVLKSSPNIKAFSYLSFITLALRTSKASSPRIRRRNRYWCKSARSGRSPRETLTVLQDVVISISLYSSVSGSDQSGQKNTYRVLQSPILLHAGINLRGCYPRVSRNCTTSSPDSIQGEGRAKEETRDRVSNPKPTPASIAMPTPHKVGSEEREIGVFEFYDFCARLGASDREGTYSAA